MLPFTRTCKDCGDQCQHLEPTAQREDRETAQTRQQAMHEESSASTTSVYRDPCPGQPHGAKGGHKGTSLEAPVSLCISKSA